MDTIKRLRQRLITVKKRGGRALTWSMVAKKSGLSLPWIFKFIKEAPSGMHTDTKEKLQKYLDRVEK